MKKIRLRLPIHGLFHGNPDGVAAGQIIDVASLADDPATAEMHARRYIRAEIAEPVDGDGAHF
jgi:hypothetical protein